MHISIDARYIRERPSGIGAYVQALITELPNMAPDDRFHLWVDPRAQRPLSTATNVFETTVKAAANGVQTLLWPSMLAPLGDVDVLHAPFNILGRGIDCTKVTTIHDLMWVLQPELCEAVTVATPLSKAFYKNGIERALRESTRIHAISQATADTIRRMDPEASKRVRVIHHGIDERFCPPGDRDAVGASVRDFLKLEDEDEYLLVMGQNSPSKNHPDVLRAFAAAELEPHIKLVLLQRLYQRGRFGLSRKSALHPLTVELGIENRVVWLSSVTDAQVVELLQGALALIQYSLFEGFGMPALEAAACGTPVVASDIPPLVEVLGGAGLHVSLDPADLTRGLRKIATEPAYRQELSEAGIRRSQDFAWERCAKAHLELYREAEAAGPIR